MVLLESADPAGKAFHVAARLRQGLLFAPQLRSAANQMHASIVSLCQEPITLDWQDGEQRGMAGFG